MEGVRSLRCPALARDEAPVPAQESALPPGLRAGGEARAIERAEVFAHRPDDQLEGACPLSLRRITRAPRRPDRRADLLARRPASTRHGRQMARKRVGLSLPVAEPIVLSAGRYTNG